MPFHIHRATCWALTCCLSGLLAAPQVLADDPASQQLRDQQRGLRQLEQQQRLERWQRQPAPAESHDATAPLPHDQRCWAITGVRVAGNRELSDSALTPTLRRFITPCMGIAEINGLLKAITQRYVQAGYPTSRPYLQQPPQDGAPLNLVIPPYQFLSDTTILVGADGKEA